MPDVRWSALDHVIAGDVVLPGSEAYEAEPKSFNARFHDLLPQAVVRCATPEDVAETVSFVRHYGLQAVPRSGGHCFAGRSSTHGVVVDVSPMGSVAVSGDRATIGAGARLGPVYQSLDGVGLAIPGGTCPSVGIAGLTLGGGLGILGRSYGVTSDRLVSAQVVLADERIVDCDDERHDDLFWALRGAGAANFGVVTSLTFRTVPATAATNLHLAWPHTKAGAVINAWQRWAPTGPDQLAASLKLTTSADLNAPPSVDVYLALFDGDADAADLVDQLVAAVGSESVSTTGGSMSFTDTRRFWARLGVECDEVPPDPLAPVPRYLFAKSEFFRRPLPAEAIESLVGVWLRGRIAGETRELDFSPWGGAYNRRPRQATAFPHRDELFQLKHAAVVAPAASAPETRAAQRWVNESWESVHPWASGRVFQNFADPDLDGWETAYYGPNYARLTQIKRRYDPDELFRFPQSLPAASP